MNSTRPGQLKGKVAFMSPEQIKDADKINRRSDVFSVGILLWTALTGCPLFQASSDAAALNNVLAKKVDPPSKVGLRPPAVLDMIALRALERDPRKRTGTALEMEESLRAAATANGLLGSKRDVAEWVNAAFGEELAERRKQIRGVASPTAAKTIPTPPRSISGLRVMALPAHAAAPPAPRPAAPEPLEASKGGEVTTLPPPPNYNQFTEETGAPEAPSSRGGGGVTFAPSPPPPPTSSPLPEPSAPAAPPRRRGSFAFVAVGALAALGGLGAWLALRSPDAPFAARAVRAPPPPWQCRRRARRDRADRVANRSAGPAAEQSADRDRERRDARAARARQRRHRARSRRGRRRPRARSPRPLPADLLPRAAAARGRGAEEETRCLGQRLAGTPPMNQRSSRSRIVRFVLACAVVSSAAAFSPPARADNADHGKRAQVAYDLQDWPTAIREYQAAYQSEQKPEYLWGLAQAQRLSGDFAAAIVTYKAFKRGEVTTNQSTAAELQITRCEAEITKKEAEAAVAARKSDAAPAAPSSAAPPAREPPPPSPKPAEPPGPKHFYADFFGDALFVTGMAAAGAGTYFLLKGNADMRDAAATPVYRDYDSGSDRASKEQVAGAIALGAGGLLVAGAIVRWLTFGPSAHDEHSAVFVGPTGVVWRGKFCKRGIRRCGIPESLEASRSRWSSSARCSPRAPRARRRLPSSAAPRTTRARPRTARPACASRDSFCSFPDNACSESGRRYADGAGIPASRPRACSRRRPPNASRTSRSARAIAASSRRTGRCGAGATTGRASSATARSRRAPRRRSCACPPARTRPR